MIEELVEYVAKSLADNPDMVQVTKTSKPRGVTYTLFLDPNDMGRVIGRNGRVAKAIRTLVSIAATREGIKAELEIRESGKA